MSPDAALRGRRAPPAPPRRPLPISPLEAAEAEWRRACPARVAHSLPCRPRGPPAVQPVSERPSCLRPSHLPPWPGLMSFTVVPWWTPCPPPLRGRSQLSAGCAGAHRLARRSAFHCVRSPHAARPAATASAFPPGARGTPTPRQVPPARVVSGFLFVCFCFFIMAIAPAALLPPHGFSLTKPPKRKGVRGV